MNQLVQAKLIEDLCYQRQELIASLTSQITLMRQTISICQRMDGMIPRAKGTNYDYLDIVFIQFRSALGENPKSSFPKDVSLMSKPIEELTSIFTSLLDRNLWTILFNRLNIFSLMSKRAKEEFKLQLKTGTHPFIPTLIESTLLDILSRQDELLINSLMDCLSNADNSYASNDRIKFKRKTIFTNALFKSNGVHWRLQSDSNFYDAIVFLSRVVFAQKRPSSDNGTLKDTLLWEKMSTYFETAKIEKLDRDEVEYLGVRAIFHNNGNVHLILSDQVITFLNDLLSKTKSLATS